MKMNTLQKFAIDLQKIAGLPCWAVIAGKGTGTRVSLQIGAKVKRGKPARNPHLSGAAREFTGEYCLFIMDCSWRLDAEKEVLCSSRSSSNLDGSEMLIGLRKIIGEQIVEVRVTPPAHDLVLYFRNGCTLHLFVDGVDKNEGCDNYVFFAKETNYVVKSKGLVAEEK